MILILSLITGGEGIITVGKSQVGTDDFETPRAELRVMWYNVENLFHPSDDSIEGDDEFIPGGPRGWTYNRYRKKLTGLAKVIVAAGQWEPPDLVGLGEVECAQVLEDLVSHPILAPYEYAYLHRESPDHRGMDVACIFRSRRFNPVDWQYVPPPPGEGFDRTREMLHIRGGWGRHDSLELFLVHFISRYRGSGSTANYRRAQAALLTHLMDSAQSKAAGHLVMAAGDFNETLDSWSLEPLAEASFSTGVFDSGEPPPGAVGTMPSGKNRSDLSHMNDSYKYRGAWSAIDFFLVGGKRERYRISSSVFRHPSLLVADQSYGGQKPYRTYEGFSYGGGYSDHLPVLLDVTRLPFSRGFGR